MDKDHIVMYVDSSTLWNTVKIEMIFRNLSTHKLYKTNIHYLHERYASCQINSVHFFTQNQ